MLFISFPSLSLSLSLDTLHLPLSPPVPASYLLHHRGQDYITQWLGTSTPANYVSKWWKNQKLNFEIMKFEIMKFEIMKFEVWNSKFEIRKFEIIILKIKAQDKNEVIKTECKRNTFSAFACSSLHCSNIVVYFPVRRSYLAARTLPLSEQRPELAGGPLF